MPRMTTNFFNIEGGFFEPVLFNCQLKSNKKDNQEKILFMCIAKSPDLLSLGNLEGKKIEEFSDIIADLFNQKISGWRIICKEKRLSVEPFGPKYSLLKLPTGKHVVFYDGVFDDMKDIPKIVNDNGKEKTLSKGQDVSQDNYRTIRQDTHDRRADNYRTHQEIK